MSKGPKPITRAEVLSLAKDAARRIEQEAPIENFMELAPVFDTFLESGKECRHAFAFLLEKGIVTAEQSKSFSNAFSEHKRRRNGIPEPTVAQAAREAKKIVDAAWKIEFENNSKHK